MPTKRIFGLIVMTWLGLEGAKGIAKGFFLRHAREDTGIVQDAAAAGSLVF